AAPVCAWPAGSLVFQGRAATRLGTRHVDSRPEGEGIHPLPSRRLSHRSRLRVAPPAGISGTVVASSGRWRDALLSVFRRRTLIERHPDGSGVCRLHVEAEGAVGAVAGDALNRGASGTPASAADHR